MHNIRTHHLLKYNVIMDLEINKILIDAQHGFRRRRSCESELLLCIDDIVKSLDKGEQIDIILLDLKKAFDKMPYQRHEKLSSKNKREML